jgi:MOSC domain-containing protein YiiM
VGGVVHRINLSSGGVPKLPVAEAEINHLGIVGDQHNDHDHGGPDRALCLYSLERIVALQAEGHPIEPGTIGENITLAGLDSAELSPGDRLSLGDEVKIELTRYTSPCKTIAASFVDGDFARALQDRHPGDSRLYARVVQGGRVRQGDRVERITTPTLT